MTKFPAYRQAGNNQIITNHQIPITQKMNPLGIGVWNLFGYWCLEFGDSHLYINPFALSTLMGSVMWWPNHFFASLWPRASPINSEK